LVVYSLSLYWNNEAVCLFFTVAWFELAGICLRRCIILFSEFLPDYRDFPSLCIVLSPSCSCSM
jgi:hypothetical protein